MSRKNPIIVKLRERVERKQKQLVRLGADIDGRQKAIAELETEALAIRLGIEEDEALLAGATPKKPRTRKAPGKVENVENQLDGGSTTGGK